MNHYRVVIAFLAMVLSLMSSSPVSASVVQVDVCHRTGDGAYKRITVSENALPAHVAHGDGVPGGPVPEQPGSVFDQNCAVVSICEPTGAACTSDADCCSGACCTIPECGPVLNTCG
jgi:hypothetical protein